MEHGTKAEAKPEFVHHGGWWHPSFTRGGGRHHGPRKRQILEVSPANRQQLPPLSTVSSH